MVCSFCKCPGHNVSSCKDSSMLAIQLDSIYIISRMICMAYLREDLPLTLHENMEMWLSELDLDHLKYILNYLKKKHISAFDWFSNIKNKCCSQYFKYCLLRLWDRRDVCVYSTQCVYIYALFVFWATCRSSRRREEILFSTVIKNWGFGL